MSVEIDIFDIQARLDQYRVAVGAGVDALLDGGVVGGDVDDRGEAARIDAINNGIIIRRVVFKFRLLL